MYIYSYLFCLYLCKDYCHRVTTQLQLVLVVTVVVVVVGVVVTITCMLIEVAISGHRNVIKKEAEKIL